MHLVYALIAALCIIVPSGNGTALKYQVNPDNLRYVGHNETRNAKTPRTQTRVAVNYEPLGSATNTQPQDNKEKPNKWLEPIVLVTAAYVVVSFFMLIAILKQGKHTSDQVAIEKGRLRQWVDTEDWKLSMRDKETLVLNGHAINRTQSPLWLDMLAIKIGGGQTGTQPIVTWLTPKKSFDIDVELRATREQSENFEVGKLVLRVHALMLFRDATENHWEQKVEFLIMSHLGDDIVQEFRTQVFDSTPKVKKLTLQERLDLLESRLAAMVDRADKGHP